MARRSESTAFATWKGLGFKAIMIRVLQGNAGLIWEYSLQRENQTKHQIEDKIEADKHGETSM